MITDGEDLMLQMTNLTYLFQQIIIIFLILTIRRIYN